MNKFYLFLLVIVVIEAIALLYLLFRIYFPSGGFNYEEEAKKHDDLKSGKFTEYEGNHAIY